MTHLGQNGLNYLYFGRSASASPISTPLTLSRFCNLVSLTIKILAEMTVAPNFLPWQKYSWERLHKINAVYFTRNASFNNASFKTVSCLVLILIKYIIRTMIVYICESSRIITFREIDSFWASPSSERLTHIWRTLCKIEDETLARSSLGNKKLANNSYPVDFELETNNCTVYFGSPSSRARCHVFVAQRYPVLLQTACPFISGI